MYRKIILSFIFTLNFGFSSFGFSSVAIAEEILEPASADAHSASNPEKAEPVEKKRRGRPKKIQADTPQVEPTIEDSSKALEDFKKTFAEKGMKIREIYEGPSNAEGTRDYMIEAKSPDSVNPKKFLIRVAFEPRTIYVQAVNYLKKLQWIKMNIPNSKFEDASGWKLEGTMEEIPGPDRLSTHVQRINADAARMGMNVRWQPIALLLGIILDAQFAHATPGEQDGVSKPQSVSSQKERMIDALASPFGVAGAVGLGILKNSKAQDGK